MVIIEALEQKLIELTIIRAVIDSTSKEPVYESEEEIEDTGIAKTDPNNLIESLELLMLETKADHDGFYDEFLNIS